MYLIIYLHNYLFKKVFILTTTILNLINYIMEENNCYYIDSQGIRKSCDMTSLINCCDLNDYNFNNLKNNDIFFF